METKTQNTIQIAEANRDKIWTSMAGIDVDSEAALLRSFAYEKEGDIIYAAKRINEIVKSIRSRMDEVQGRMDIGCTDGLNGCGILQNLDHDLDTEVTKIKTLAANRVFYSHLLK